LFLLATELQQEKDLGYSETLKVKEHKKKIIMMNKKIKNKLRRNNTYTDFIDSHNVYAGIYLIRCFKEIIVLLKIAIFLQKKVADEMMFRRCRAFNTEQSLIYLLLSVN